MDGILEFSSGRKFRFTRKDEWLFEDIDGPLVKFRALQTWSNLPLELRKEFGPVGRKISDFWRRHHFTRWYHFTPIGWFTPTPWRMLREEWKRAPEEWRAIGNRPVQLSRLELGQTFHRFLPELPILVLLGAYLYMIRPRD